jgi:ABC-type nitrate/sulfonate/bicarbonate transport system permease component
MVLKKIWSQSWLALLLVAILWIVTATSSSLYFPPLSEVLTNLKDQLVHGSLRHDLVYSLKNLLVGLGFATVVGVFFGLIIGERPRLRIATGPVLDFLRATPYVALVPVILLTLGLNAGPRIFLIAFGCVWAILLNTIAGVQGITPAVIETSRSFRIPWLLRLRRVVIPGAMPQIFAGLRVALSVGIVLMVISELYGSTEGLGFFILTSGSNFLVVDTWSGTLLIGLLGYALSMVLVVIEHVTLRWHRQQPARVKRPKANGTTTSQLVSSTKV